MKLKMFLLIAFIVGSDQLLGQENSSFYFEHLSREEFYEQLHACVLAAFNEIGVPVEEADMEGMYYGKAIDKLDKIIHKKFKDSFTNDTNATKINYNLTWELDSKNKWLSINLFMYVNNEPRQEILLLYGRIKEDQLWLVQMLAKSDFKKFLKNNVN